MDDWVSGLKTVFLASCVKMKAGFPLPAEELYVSDWFKKARAYILGRMAPQDRWYILSAKYGLVEPGRMIEPYNQTPKEMPTDKRRQWAEQVLVELGQILGQRDTVILLAGQRYREFLENPLRAEGRKLCVPMRNLGIGEQLRWLKTAISKGGAGHECGG
jgi:hypothetical protein